MPRKGVSHPWDFDVLKSQPGGSVLLNFSRKST